MSSSKGWALTGSRDLNSLFEGPLIGRKILAHILLITLLLFYALTLAGCAQGLSGIFLIQLQFPGSSTSLRLGYYNLCLIDSGKANCVKTAFSSSNAILDRLSESSSGVDLTNIAVELVNAAVRLQGRAFLGILTVAAGPLTAGLFAELYHFYLSGRAYPMGMTPSQKRSINFWRQSTLAFVWAATALALAAVLANMQVVVAMQIESSSKVISGVLSLAFHWVIFALSLVFAASLTMFTRGHSGVQGKLDNLESGNFGSNGMMGTGIGMDSGMGYSTGGPVIV